MLTQDPLALLFERATDAGVSMMAICDRAGVAPTTPSRWKHKKASPSLSKLMELHSALDAILSDRRAA